MRAQPDRPFHASSRDRKRKVSKRGQAPSGEQCRRASTVVTAESGLVNDPGPGDARSGTFRILEQKLPWRQTRDGEHRAPGAQGWAWTSRPPVRAPRAGTAALSVCGGDTGTSRGGLRVPSMAQQGAEGPACLRPLRRCSQCALTPRGRKTRNCSLPAVSGLHPGAGVGSTWAVGRGGRRPAGACEGSVLCSLASFSSARAAPWASGSGLGGYSRALSGAHLAPGVLELSSPWLGGMLGAAGPAPSGRMCCWGLLGWGAAAGQGRGPRRHLCLLS